MTIKSCSNLAPGKQKLLFAKETALRFLTDIQVRTWAVLSKPAGTSPPHCTYLDVAIRCPAVFDDCTSSLLQGLLI